MARFTLKSASGADVLVQEGESADITATFVDLSGADFVKASIVSLTMTLFDEADPHKIINGWDGTKSCLDENGGVLSTAGVLTLELQPADNVILNPLTCGECEPHVAKFEWTWISSVTGNTRTGVQETVVRVENLVDPTT